MKQRTAVRELILTALFAALTAVFSQIRLPIGPVPFNLGVFGAYLAGMLLSPLWAGASMGVYMLLGAVGIPVFAGFMAGPTALFGPTGGYIMGYLFIAVLTSFAAHRTQNTAVTAAAMLLGLVICYGLGTVWFMTITGTQLQKALMACVVPFIIPDLGKAAAALWLGRQLSHRMRKAGVL